MLKVQKPGLARRKADHQKPSGKSNEYTGEIPLTRWRYGAETGKYRIRKMIKANATGNNDGQSIVGPDLLFVIACEPIADTGRHLSARTGLSGIRWQGIDEHRSTTVRFRNILFPYRIRT